SICAANPERSIVCEMEEVAAFPPLKKLFPRSGGPGSVGRGHPPPVPQRHTPVTPVVVHPGIDGTPLQPGSAGPASAPGFWRRFVPSDPVPPPPPPAPPAPVHKSI